MTQDVDELYLTLTENELVYLEFAKIRITPLGIEVVEKHHALRIAEDVLR